MENEIYSVLDKLEDYENFNRQLDTALNKSIGHYAEQIKFETHDNHLYINVKFGKHDCGYSKFDIYHILCENYKIFTDFDDIAAINNAIQKIQTDIGVIKFVSFDCERHLWIEYIPYTYMKNHANKSTVKRRKTVIDKTSMVINLPRFNQNAFEFGNAYFLKMKSVDKAMALLKYKHHCDDKINSWIPECHLDDIAKSLEYGVYALFKDITYQGTLITFFVAYRSIGTDTNKKCVELSIPIDAIDDIEITKLDIDAFDRKVKTHED